MLRMPYCMWFYYYNVGLYIPILYSTTNSIQYQNRPFSTSNNFMEKGKPRGSIADELALAKSAAWAWLDHHSGSDDWLTPEFNVSRIKCNPKPSRYRVEAMTKVQETPNSTSKVSVCPWSTAVSSRGDSNYPLLDRYEIERISRQLDYYMQSSHANHHGGDHRGRGVGAVAAAEIKGKSVRKKKVSRGFWLLGSHPVACGSSIDEVVARTSIEYSRRRQRRPEKGHVAVVEVVGCRPRQGIRA